MSVIIGNNCKIINSEIGSTDDYSYIIVNGIELPSPPTSCNNITTINGKVYIDGYEFKNGRWKKTLRAWWHLWF